MRRGAHLLAISFLGFFSILLLSVDAGPLSLTEKRALEMQQMKVGILLEGAIDGSPEKFTGSGVIASLEGGIVFTNHHVIRPPGLGNRLTIKSVKINVNTPYGLPDTVDAKVLMKSEIHDFAVLQFDPEKLNRSKGWARAAKLPTADEYHKIVRQGAEVVAYGDPMDIRNNATFGRITNIPRGRDWEISNKKHYGEESWILTDAAISTGNSGGPLNHEKTGMTLALMRCQVTGGQNMNFGIPIIPLIEDFNDFVRRAGKGRNGYVSVKVGEYDSAFLELEGLMSKVEESIPHYSHYYPKFLMVQGAEDSLLESGDILLRIDGEPIGNNFEKVNQIIKYSPKPELEFEVLRKGEILKLSQRVSQFNEIMAQRDSRFVHVSGAFVQDMSDSEKIQLFSHPGVIVTQIDSGSVAEEQSEEMKLHLNSVITAVFIKGERFPVGSINDFERLMAQFKEGEVVRLVTHQPLRAEGGKRLYNHGYSVISALEKIIFLPISQVTTDKTAEIENEIAESEIVTSPAEEPKLAAAGCHTRVAAVTALKKISP